MKARKRKPDAIDNAPAFAPAYDPHLKYSFTCGMRSCSAQAQPGQWISDVLAPTGHFRSGIYACPADDPCRDLLYHALH